MTDRENGLAPYDTPLTSVWVWKNPNGHIARGESFMTKADCERRFANCLGRPIRFVAPGGSEFKAAAIRWLITKVKSK